MPIDSTPSKPFHSSALFTRRRWLGTGLAGGAATVLPGTPQIDPARASDDGGLRLAPFRFDVTPPPGHPLCGGWITPVKSITDSLEATGFVLLGAGEPIVVCAVDWTGLLNEAHFAWREALAKAAGTQANRVAVQCVHQHDAPFVCLASETLLEQEKTGLHLMEADFFRTCLDRATTAVAEALATARPLTHVASGEAEVERIASNRRVEIGPDGRIGRMRGSSSRVQELIDLPEGLVDPMLKTVVFYSGAEKIAACHYYACHPMSHYGKGEVSSDFVGLARKRMQAEEPDCLQLYFTGCGGNIGAGKYNNGSPEARVEMTERLYSAMVEAGRGLRPKPLQQASWATHDLLPAVNPVFTEESEMALLRDDSNSAANRIRPAMRLSWIRRVAEKKPIVLSALHLDEISLLHLPAECFVEYQLRAQEIAAARFVATAAYGDGGPWYIPTKEAYPLGGYEVSVANCAPTVDDRLTKGMRDLLDRA